MAILQRKSHYIIIKDYIMAISVVPVKNVIPASSVELEDIFQPGYSAIADNTAESDLISALTNTAPASGNFSEDVRKRYSNSIILTDFQTPQFGNDNSQNITEADTHFPLSSVILLQNNQSEDQETAPFALENDIAAYTNTENNDTQTNSDEENTNQPVYVQNELFPEIQPVPPVSSYTTNIINALQGGLNVARPFTELENRADLEV
jgi:hypothetical protein